MTKKKKIIFLPQTDISSRYCLFKPKMLILIFFAKSIFDPKWGSLVLVMFGRKSELLICWLKMHFLISKDEFYVLYPDLYKIGISICKIEVGFHIILIRIEK